MDEVVEGKGRSAGEAKSAATHAIAAAGGERRRAARGGLIRVFPSRGSERRAPYLFGWD